VILVVPLVMKTQKAKEIGGGITGSDRAFIDAANSGKVVDDKRKGTFASVH
jgi:hypothetical protein